MQRMVPRCVATLCFVTLLGSLVAAQDAGVPNDALARTVLPDPPCFDNSSRFVNCGNGTVTDTATGLVWLEHASCLAYLDYAAANEAVSMLADGQCGLSDGSHPGDWRLPTEHEWEAMVRKECRRPKIVGNGIDCSPEPCCYLSTPWAFRVQVFTYWSGTTDPDFTLDARAADLWLGSVIPHFKPRTAHAWPVRDGR